MRADHDQQRGAHADEEPLDAAVPDHEPEEPVIAGNTGAAGAAGQRQRGGPTDETGQAGGV